MSGGPEGSRKAIVAALGANFGIALAKLVGFAVTGAASMLAQRRSIRTSASSSQSADTEW